ncbi:hypothetical protein HanPI659440_Chr07g0270481 [Helianthus annuus]|nr:hypothetical protein HanPI659440_Chr07g0270481 [Helianthus annuus]
MHPFRPPFGVPARPMNPNTTQPQHPYNLQDMDPSVLTYAAYLSGATPFVPPTFGGQAGGSQPSQQQAEPDVDVVPETQPEPVPDKSKRDRRSHKKKEKDEPRRKNTHLKWSKDEEFTLTRAWLDVLEDHGIGNFLTKTLDEFEKMKCPFPYYKCWDLLRKSPKWALVGTMTSSSRRRAKRSKTSSFVDPETPTSDARNVNLNEVVDVDEELEEEFTDRPVEERVSEPGKKRWSRLPISS